MKRAFQSISRSLSSYAPADDVDKKKQEKKVTNSVQLSPLNEDYFSFTHEATPSITSSNLSTPSSPLSPTSPALSVGSAQSVRHQYSTNNPSQLSLVTNAPESITKSNSRSFAPFAALKSPSFGSFTLRRSIKRPSFLNLTADSSEKSMNTPKTSRSAFLAKSTEPTSPVMDFLLDTDPFKCEVPSPQQIRGIACQLPNLVLNFANPSKVAGPPTPLTLQPIPALLPPWDYDVPSLHSTTAEEIQPQISLKPEKTAYQESSFPAGAGQVVCFGSEEKPKTSSFVPDASSAGRKVSTTPEQQPPSRQKPICDDMQTPKLTKAEHANSKPRINEIFMQKIDGRQDLRQNENSAKLGRSKKPFLFLKDAFDSAVDRDLPLPPVPIIPAVRTPPIMPAPPKEYMARTSIAVKNCPTTEISNTVKGAPNALTPSIEFLSGNSKNKLTQFDRSDSSNTIRPSSLISLSSQPSLDIGKFLTMKWPQPPNTLGRERRSTANVIVQHISFGDAENLNSSEKPIQGSGIGHFRSKSADCLTTSFGKTSIS